MSFIAGPFDRTIGPFNDYWNSWRNPETKQVMCPGCKTGVCLMVIESCEDWRNNSHFVCGSCGRREAICGQVLL